MSQWQEQIRNHPVWQTLQDLGPAIDLVAARDGVDAVGLDLIDRFRTVHAFVGRRLAAQDPALVYQPAFDNIGTAFQQSAAEFQAFLSDGQQSHLETAHNHASTALLHLASLAAPAAPEDLTALSQAAASYRSTLEKHADAAKRAVADLQADAGQLKTRIDEIAAEVSTERARLTSLASDFQSQFSTAQDARATEFSEAQAVRGREAVESQSARQARFDELMTSYSQRLNDRDAEHTRELNEIKKATEERLSALKVEYEASATSLDSEYRASARTILTAIEEHKAAVEKLVGVIGNLGVTSGYQKVAESSKRSMWLWQFLTVSGFAIVIAFAYWAFLPAIQNEFTWEKFAGRVVLTIAVGVFAAYAAAQADRYMESERRNRKMALELEVLGPYLAPLPDDKQQEFRLALADRTFGREEHGFGRRDRSPATPFDVVLSNKGLRDFLVELMKAARGS